MKWREIYKVHPLAEILPRMSAKELKELADDIRKNHLQQKVVVWQLGDTSEMYVVDGISRLDAMESIGIIPWGKDGKLETWAVDHHLYVPGISTCPNLAHLVIALNLHRRHLSIEQRIKLATELITSGKKWKWGDAVAPPAPQVAPITHPSAKFLDKSERDAEIKRRLLIGETQRQIAKALDVSAGTISKVCKMIKSVQVSGLDQMGKGKTGQTKTTSAIAELAQVAPSTVRRHKAKTKPVKPNPLRKVLLDIECLIRELDVAALGPDEHAILGRIAAELARLNLPNNPSNKELIQ